MDLKYKKISKNLNKYSYDYLRKINLKYIVLCENLSISGINTAAGQSRLDYFSFGPTSRDPGIAILKFQLPFLGKKDRGCSEDIERNNKDNNN